MTKNRTMRVAVLMLALTLITSCFVGGTFAKYTTETYSSDYARVAVWGINAGTVEMDLFDESYDATNVTVNANEDASGYQDNLIAPGTTKTSAFNIVTAAANLAPEVDYNLTIDLNGSAINESIKNNANIQWSLDGGEYGTWDKLMTDILRLTGDTEVVYDAATTTSATVRMESNEIAEEFANGKTHEITWRWVFDADSSGAAPSFYDDIDNAMGNAAVTSDLQVSLYVTITATQID